MRRPNCIAPLRLPTRSSLAEAIDWIERALAIDPRSAEAQSWLAYVYAFRVLNQMTDKRAVDIARAEELVAQALAAWHRNPLVHLAKGQVLRMQGRYEEAIPHFQQAKQFDPNSGLLPGFFLAVIYDLTGRNSAAITEYEEFLKAHPTLQPRGEIEARLRVLKSRNSRP